MSTKQIWPAVVFFMQRAPRTIPELSQLTGSHPKDIRRNLALMVEEGLIRAEPGARRPVRGRTANVYHWQTPESFASELREAA